MIYVMSDIHGNIDRYKSIIEQINLQDADTLYVLGDVIDRYPDGIKILREIMKKDNVKMLLGNHEYMMLEALENNNTDDLMTQFEREEATDLWYRNGGRVTHNYLKHLRKDIRAEIFRFLKTLPVNIKISVNDKDYLLVHGAPEDNFEQFKSSFDFKKEYAIWKRWQPTDAIPEGYTLIFGHTPTIHFQDNDPLEIWQTENAIGIDCGCGFPKSKFTGETLGRLACLRLDDMKVFYSKEEG